MIFFFGDTEEKMREDAVCFCVCVWGGVSAVSRHSSPSRFVCVLNHAFLFTRLTRDGENEKESKKDTKACLHL